MTFTLTVPGTDDHLEQVDNGFAHNGQTFPIIEHGIIDLMPASSRDQLDAFATDYAAVRAAEGRELDADAVRRLPWIDPGHELAEMWAMRNESQLRLRAQLPAQPGTMIDIGAGCGWLAARLSDDGWEAAAVDITVTGGDGLAAARHHQAELLLARADMGVLPFASDSIDLAVFNASLHYAADVPAALHEATRVVRPGGLVAVLDSPVFSDPAAGHQMVAEFDASVAERHGLRTATHQGPGFVTWAQLAPFSLTEPDATNLLAARFHRWRGARRAGRETAQRPLLIGPVAQASATPRTSPAPTAHPGTHQ